jgi:hypothetical protein
MSVSNRLTVSDYDTNHPGQELRCVYNVQNTSPPDSINNLIQFTLPAGSNQGVYQTLSPTGWSAQVNSNDTVFSGNGNYIAPGDAVNFRLYSYLTATTSGSATAINGDPEAFNPVMVLVPAVNAAPVVATGTNLTVALPGGAALAGSVTDATLPYGGALTSAWSVVSGPGGVNFADASATNTTASFTVPGVYALRLTGSDGELAATGTVAVTVLDSFAAWEARHGVSGATGDPDGDGLANLVEYAGGWPPLTNNPAAGPGGTVTNGWLTLRYQRSRWAADVTCAAEVSGSVMGGWSSAASDVEQEWQVTDSPDGNTQTVIARDKTPVAGAGSRFIRLRVSQP